jgi:hypothetical protein
MSNNTNVYFEQMGNKLVVADGGEIEVQSGGTLDLQTGSSATLSFAGSVTYATSTNVTWEAGAEADFASGSTVSIAGTANVSTGGNVVFQSGASIDLQSGSTGTIAGAVAVATGGYIDFESGSVVSLAGTLTVESGGIVNVASGGALQIAATDVTQLVYDGPSVAFGVVDFNAVAEATIYVVIDSVTFTEAPTASFINGQWTNGATITTSAISFVSAVNLDTRGGGNDLLALLLDGQMSVLISQDVAGAAGNASVTTDSGGNVTVEDLHDGADAAIKRNINMAYVVTAQDLLSDEVNIVLPFTPTSFTYNVAQGGGSATQITLTSWVSIETGPDRIKFADTGGTDPASGNIIYLSVFE